MKSSPADPGDGWLPLLEVNRRGARIYGWVRVAEPPPPDLRGYIDMRLGKESRRRVGTPRDVLGYVDGAWAWLELGVGITGGD